MEIGCNKFQFIGKTILLSIVLFLGIISIYHPPKIHLENAPLPGIIFLTAITSIVFVMLFLMALQLIFLPKGVEIDEQNETLTLKFLLSNPITLSTDEISNFSTIIINTKSNTYNGLMIKVKGGKEYIVGDFNLSDYKPVKIFLESTKIKFAGHYKFGFIAYFIKYFRTKSKY